MWKGVLRAQAHLGYWATQLFCRLYYQEIGFKEVDKFKKISLKWVNDNETCLLWDFNPVEASQIGF